jgi:CHRD domain
MTRSRVAALVLAVLSISSAQAQTTQYRARLSVVPIDVAMQSTIAGSGSATAILKGNTLTINGTFSGLKTAATVARVHRGPRTGMRGVPIGDLTATAETSGAITGSIELTKEHIDDLAAGRLYIQLHSQKAPDGNLWGWLLVPEGKK